MSTSVLGTMHESQNKRDGRRLTAPQPRKRTKTAAPPEDACASSSRCTRGSEAEDWRSAKDGWVQLEREGHVKTRTPSDLSMAWHYLVSAALNQHQGTIDGFIELRDFESRDRVVN